MKASKTLKNYLTQNVYLNGVKLSQNDDFAKGLNEDMKDWNKSQHQYALSNTIEFAEENPDTFFEGYEVKRAYMALGYESGIIEFTDGTIMTINIEEECCFC